MNGSFSRSQQTGQIKSVLHNLSDSFGMARRAEDSFVCVGESPLLHISLRFAAGSDVLEICASLSGCCSDWTIDGLIAHCVDAALL